MSVGPKQYKPSARELFPVLRRRLLESRPVIEPATVQFFTHALSPDTRRNRARVANGEAPVIEKTQTRRIPAVYGRPTFRNATFDGRHV